MTQAEANILGLISMSPDRTLTILQWWVSITIGLAAVGHFVGKKLNTPLACVLLANWRRSCCIRGRRSA